MNDRLHVFRHRWFKTVGLLAVLAGLAVYGYLYNPVGKLSKCLADPERHDGRIIGVGTEAKVVELLPEGFVIQELGQRIAVAGDLPKASPGDYIRIRAIFHKEGYLELDQLYVAKGRRAKIFVSIVPALLVIFLLFRTYRFDWRQLLFRERI